MKIASTPFFLCHGHSDQWRAYRLMPQVPHLQARLKKPKARSWAPTTIAWLPRIYLRTNIIRLRHSRT